MPRKKLIRQSQFPYHVTIRTNNKNWFQLPLSEVWNICKEALVFALSKNSVDIHCFVLMSNHYHLLLSTPNSDIDKFMRSFNSRVSLLITRSTSEINRKFNSPYSWCIVEGENYLQNVYRYIYQNPVRSGVTKNCQSYPFSSIHFSRYEAKLFNYKPHIIYGNEKSWFESIFDKEVEKIMSRSLRKERFAPPNRISSHSRTILK